MTSEVDALKTNEFLRRRKLRIQQVREQSKDIAKKIRQRANAEKFKHLVSLDATKERDYLEHQDKLVKKLEQLHAKSIVNLGTGHKNAAETTQQENKQEKVDLSKQRAREAATELRRKKQEKLDERKKLLDRKLHAREIANELSREKSSVVANKLSKSSVKITEESQKTSNSEVVPEQAPTSELLEEKDKELDLNDMATQCGHEPLSNEWEPNIPILSLPKEDSPKTDSKTPDNQSDKSKRPNLFALSDEMPSSLRGGLTEYREDASSNRPSLTLVSDYLQNRDLRLRDFDSKPGNKKSTEDLQKLKQTILRTRASKAEGSIVNPVHVADVQVVPVPSWRAEVNCEPCSNNINHNQHSCANRQFQPSSKAQINRISSSIRPKPDLQPTPVLRGSSPFKRNKFWPGSFSAKKSDRPYKKDNLENVLGKKSSVTMYNHSTRDLRDVPFEDRKLVLRDSQYEEDAYYQAMKETSAEQVAKEKDHQKKLQDMRNKIAMTKQNVEKEYKDTMAFLKTLSKDKDKPIKSAYKDAHQEQMLKAYKQRKLQHEFRKIQRENRKQANLTLKPCSKVKCPRMRNSEHEDDFDSQDLQYSWMPVPESDRGLAVHIIPTKIKEQKSGNTVKFSKIDSYHEYRSRHKHTPPTKDTCGNDCQKVTEPEFIDDPNSETSTSTLVDTSSVEDLRLGKDKGAKSSDSDKYSEAERIIIYKILDSKSDKRAKGKKKATKKSVSKSLSFTNKEESHSGHAEKDSEKGDAVILSKANNVSNTSDDGNTVSPKCLKEGIYKTVKQKGLAYSITNCYAANIELWETSHCYHPWWDNISFTRITEEQKQHGSLNVNRPQQHIVDRACGGSKEIDVGDLASESQRGASSSSFKTASNDKKAQPHQQLEKNVEETAGLPPGGFVKVIDEKGQESGKFYIGATGFLKDDAYEVIIKLRKTDTTQTDKKDAIAGDQKLETTATVESEKTTPTTSSDSSSNLPTKIGVDIGVGEEKINIVDLNANVAPVSMNEQKNLVDKGVDVPLDPLFYRKESINLKPGTSVSVQTTLDSPELRYHHRMSSSTSTAYLSPPEVIVPRYLNRNNYNKRYMPFEPLNPEVYILNHDPRPYPRKSSAKSKPNQSPPAKNIQRGKTLKTPPNTARSCSSEYSRSTRSRAHSPCKQRVTPAAVVPKTVKKHRCERRCASKTCLKPHARKTKRISSTNPVAPPPSERNTSTHNSRTTGLGISSRAYDLDPVVKRYVDKLLQMNKEGMKAMDVLNQDCSSVTTPGSSIIENLNNIDQRNNKLEPNISLEQLRQLIAQHIMKKCVQNLEEYESQATIGETGLKVNSKSSFRLPKKRSVHKVKSLNISRNMNSKNISTGQKPIRNGSSSCPVSGSSSKDEFVKSDASTKPKHRSKSSPSPRRPDINSQLKLKTNENDLTKMSCINNGKVQPLADAQKFADDLDAAPSQDSRPVVFSRNLASSDSAQQPTLPLHTSTQTNRNIDEDINYIKMAEDKLQNMEKIADLTEKCTQRLSNLAKVLEEVRKNKLSYSHASESASDTDQVSGQNSDSRVPVTTYEPIIEIKEKETPSPPPSEEIHSAARISICSPTKPSNEVEKNSKDNKKDNHHSKRPKSPIFSAKTHNVRSPISMSTDTHNLKSRGKPPPALIRCLKRTQEFVVPHELSTVVEVDSPVSMKYKSQSSRPDTKLQTSIGSDSEKEEKTNDNGLVTEEKKDDPDLLDTNNANKYKETKKSDESADDSKMQMMDLKQFNDIMLKPFISIQEYAKQCKMTKLEEGSNIETLLRGDVINDEMSSLHSDGSLPDVIAELLKRNIISEPFKFDTASNINSTTASSDSTLSVLALSKMKRGQKKISTLSNKENLEETSDTLSNSSNPDLENAFKKLGMGWASSTLKKTKEHLALSSSSTNTSSSSLSQFKLKSVRIKDFPALVTDSMSSIRNATNISSRNEQIAPVKSVIDGTKTAAQQTSLANSFTVKQFLTNELAKRITFGDNFRKNDTEEEFVSLCETKMPEDMLRTSKHEERSFDSNARARTSTPVQIYKSMTYHTSSSSNVSNGLFSNADDLSSVKGTSNSLRNHSTSEKGDLTIPNFSLRMRKGLSSDCSRSDE